jgi:hypothetical protein
MLSFVEQFSFNYTTDNLDFIGCFVGHNVYCCPADIQDNERL